MILNYIIIDYGSLVDGLYKLPLDSDNISSSLVVENFVAKRSKAEEKTFILWHKHLGYISRERGERLTKTYILPSLDFDDLGTCVDCIRRNFTKT